MSIELLSILMFICVLGVFALGTPVGFGLGAIAMGFGYFTWGPPVFNIAGQTAFDQIKSFILLAVPMFIFMGQILHNSGLGESLFNAVYVLMGRLRGGLAVGVIFICSLLGAMIGIIGAGIITSGSVALKPMLDRGYNKYLALGSIMAGGSMAILIPPSIPMILFSSVTTSSLGKMFAGAIMPALLTVTLFSLYIIIRCFINPGLAPAIPLKELVARPRARLYAVRDAGSCMTLIGLVLGAILFGLATPTEAAALGGLGAMLIALLYRRLSPTVVKDASTATLSMASSVMWILVGASIFSNFHMMMGAHKLLTNLTIGAGLSPMTVIILMQLSMLVMGCMMDDYVIVLICAPLYTPIAMSLGFDPIWFGILMILNLQIAVQTPPYGFALFYLKTVAPPEVSMLDLYKSVAPFIIMLLMVMGACMAFPELVTWLPSKLFN